VQIQQLITALQLSLRLTRLVEHDSYDSSEKKNGRKKTPPKRGNLDWSSLFGILSDLDSLGLQVILDRLNQAKSII
jgi:hypothetical protein